MRQYDIMTSSTKRATILVQRQNDAYMFMQSTGTRALSRESPINDNGFYYTNLHRKAMKVKIWQSISSKSIMENIIDKAICFWFNLYSQSVLLYCSLCHGYPGSICI